MIESRMWKIVRSSWLGWGYRIEASAGGVDVGFPDVVMGACGHGGILVELKCRGTPLSREQKAWWAAHEDSGGGGFILCWVRRDVWWLGKWDEYRDNVDDGEGLAEVLARVHRASVSGTRLV